MDDSNEPMTVNGEEAPVPSVPKRSASDGIEEQLIGLGVFCAMLSFVILFWVFPYNDLLVIVCSIPLTLILMILVGSAIAASYEAILTFWHRLKIKKYRKRQ